MPEPELDVAFLPGELRETEVAVVVDVLRATSTITQALAAGYESVHCAPSIEAARALRAPGRLLAGEEDCLPVPGFDLGNSPAALARSEAAGKELVLATTNGTPAIGAAVQHAEHVLLGCLLHLDALLAAIPAGAAVTVVCSGTDKRFALEDAYLAGRIVERLEGAPSDAARAALCVGRAYAGALEPLRDSADGRVLLSTDQEADIEWCAQESVLDVVPRVVSDGDGAPVVAAVGDKGQAGHRQKSIGFV
ncbi:MAG: 2-phosphosulfolactate phosphatase [Thermoleophilaceae bacterium]|nr:2-phosphosulfolactate phosphatase [Thermoleophilaceae bacterium]